MESRNEQSLMLSVCRLSKVNSLQDVRDSDLLGRNHYFKFAEVCLVGRKRAHLLACYVRAVLLNRRFGKLAELAIEIGGLEEFLYQRHFDLGVSNLNCLNNVAHARFEFGSRTPMGGCRRGS